MDARVTWNDGVSFVATSGTGHRVTMDGPPDQQGRAQLSRQGQQRRIMANNAQHADSSTVRPMMRRSLAVPAAQ